MQEMMRSQVGGQPGRAESTSPLSSFEEEEDDEEEE